jgi:ABC-type transporter MlaC component
MNRRDLLHITAATLLCLPAKQALAGGDHGSYVLNLMQELIALAAPSATTTELRPKIVAVLSARADVRAISMFALGSWRKNLPAKLRDEYMRLTVEYTARSFETYVNKFPGASVRLEETRKDKGVITVSTVLDYANGQQSQIRFRFTTPGPMLVKDVNVQGIWLSLRLRDQFASVLKHSKGDFAALLGFLKEGTA